jgi:16S rRNA (adenine1518-N6/adenine1519-N6)-dimethyltransferase
MRPRKRFGQHFLEPQWVAKLVAAIEPLPTDRFIEIGPGRGAITEPLAARVEHVLAIEVDRDLASALEKRALPNVAVVTADVLTVELAELARQAAGDSPSGPSGIPTVRVAGNLPYNISSPILFRLLDLGTTGLVTDATLMLQKEVADRLVAEPGTRDYGVLTLTTALGADVERVLSLPPGAFRPPPKVHSAVVRLTFRPPPPDVPDRALATQIIRAVFTQRRKTLSNALERFASSRGVSARQALLTADIDPKRRPETLLLTEVARLATVLGAKNHQDRCDAPPYEQP